jgi:hypothetical protein
LFASFEGKGGEGFGGMENGNREKIRKIFYIF